MKRYLLAAIVCVLPMASIARAEGPANLDLAERLVVVMEVEENTEKSLEMVRQMIPGMMEQMGVPSESEATALQTAALDLVWEEMGWSSMKDEIIAMYAEIFSAEELEGMIAFFESPVGQGFVAKQPEVMQKTLQISQSRLAGLMPKLQALMEEKVSVMAPAPDAR